MSLEPNDQGILNTYAWLLATCTDHSLRNGRRAVELASRAVQLSNGSNADYLDTLAAAHAQAGRFQDAIATQERAVSVAMQQGVDQNTIAGYQNRLDLYRQGRANP